MGLSERMNFFPSQLSGGEQQRVAVARALAKKPDLLLCDEPTGSLDEKSSVHVLSLLRELNKTLRTTIIMITHARPITKIADTEPEEVKLLFEGKSMTCTWTQGNFDEDLVNTFSLGIENCEGRLALAIASLVEVMLEEAEAQLEVPAEEIV